MTPKRLPWLPFAFVGVLLVVGVGFLALAAERAMHPRTQAAPDLAAKAEADLEKRGFSPLTDGQPKDDYKPIPTQSHPLLGETAPDFTLDDTDGKPWHLADALKKGPVVLVFYYGYNCDHCVSQLFGLHKDIDTLRKAGATVVAVSADPVKLTRQRYAEYGAFAFPVLSDSGNVVAQKYGVYLPAKDGAEGNLYHGTFLITRQGKVVWVNSGGEPFTEHRTLLVEIERLPKP